MSLGLFWLQPRIESKWEVIRKQTSTINLSYNIFITKLNFFYPKISRPKTIVFLLGRYAPLKLSSRPFITLTFIKNENANVCLIPKIKIIYSLCINDIQSFHFHQNKEWALWQDYHFQVVHVQTFKRCHCTFTPSLHFLSKLLNS